MLFLGSLVHQKQLRMEKQTIKFVNLNYCGAQNIFKQYDCLSKNYLEI